MARPIKTKVTPKGSPVTLTGSVRCGNQKEMLCYFLFMTMQFCGTGFTYRVYKESTTHTHTHTHTLLKRLFSPPSWKGQRRFSTAQAGHAWQSSLAALCAWSAYSTGPLLPSLLLPQDTLPHKPPRAAAMGHGRCASGHGGVSKVSSYLLGLSNAGAELMEHHIPHPCVPVPTEPVSQLSRPPWGVWRTDGKLFKNLQRSPSRQTVSFLLPL